MSRTPTVAESSAPDETGSYSQAGPVVRFEGVGMRYGRAAEVLRDVTFELPRGSFHFLTGPAPHAPCP